MRIIWLKTGPVHPLDTGGKIRTFNMLRELKRSHDITYVALCPPDTQETIKKAAAEYCHRAIWVPWQEPPKSGVNFPLQLAANQFASALPYVIRKYRSLGMAAAIHALNEGGLHDLVVCDFLTPSVNLFPAGRHPSLPTLLFQHNVESQIWQRLYEQSQGTLKRWYFQSQWRRMERYERGVCTMFDAVVGVSSEDCDLMQLRFQLNNVLGHVPTGVDCETYAPATQPREPNSLVFLGSMDWMPNIDAVEYFTTDIWSLVRKAYPEATFTIVGRRPVEKVKGLERRVPGVRVTGTVEDVKPYLHAATVMVVPLRVGGGTRIKIFEAMATGIPVVSTRIGAEGLPVKHGENILLADTPEDFAKQIGIVLKDRATARRIGAAGRALVQSHFGWDKASAVFEDYCLRAVEIGKKRT